jgi:hypothetical protein
LISPNVCAAESGGAGLGLSVGHCAAICGSAVFSAVFFFYFFDVKTALY